LTLILLSLHFKHDKVVVEIGGGMGNQMFQAAAAFSFAKKHKKRLVLIKNSAYRNTYWSQTLHSFADCQAFQEQIQSLDKKAHKVYKERDPQYHSIPPDATWIEGYF
jgi:hypothetical protein